MHIGTGSVKTFQFVHEPTCLQLNRAGRCFPHLFAFKEESKDDCMCTCVCVYKGENMQFFNLENQEKSIKYSGLNNKMKQKEFIDNYKKNWSRT